MRVCVEKTENHIALYDLSSGDIIFKRYADNSRVILEDYEYLDKDYINSIIDNLSEDEQYDLNYLDWDNKYILAVSGRSEQLCPKCKVPMKALYDKMACFKCMTHTP